MYKKIIPTFLIFLFIFIFSYINYGEYYNFYKSKRKLETQKINQKNNLENFSLDKIKILKNTEIFYTPEEKVLEKILQKINNAKQKIYIEVYMLTQKKIKETLKKVKQKNIEIKVILEKNPYKAYNINNKTYDFLKNSGIEVVWSNPKNYSLNHSKFMIIDDEAIISTGNLTYSTFKYNRDFFVFSSDKNLVEKLNQIFIGDFLGEKNYTFFDNFIISPHSSRKKFEKLFLKAKKDIKLYFQYFHDEKLTNLLIQKLNQGIKVSIIIDKKNYQKTLEKFQKYIGKGLDIKKLEKINMHSKAILIDEKYLYLGSINFSQYSIDKNREIGIIFKNTEIISKFLKIFKIDFYQK